MPRRHRFFLYALVAAGTASLPAAAVPPQPQPRAGQVVRVVPAVFLERAGEGAKAAGPQMPVNWLDAVKTERLARARVRLDDGSLLNIGPESSLTIRQHQAAEQRTELELQYGKMRSQVVKAARQGSGFRVRTPVAVAGVVGTEFWVGVVQDYTDVLCLEDEVRVENSDEKVKGFVILHAGEFTRVMRGKPPSPPVKAPPEKIREVTEETEVPGPSLAWSHAEVSWPPAACGEGVSLLVRVWEKKTGSDGKETESPVDPDNIVGSLEVGGATLKVEDGVARLASAPTATLPTGKYSPGGAAQPIETKFWEPREFVAGEGWRAPRAVFAGSAFYVLGPMGAAGLPSFNLGGVTVPLLWSGPCGAGFLAPATPTGEQSTSLMLRGRAVAQGKMNLVAASYRLPNPPAAMRGQTSNFGIDLRGLERLGMEAEGRPVMTAIIVNRTPAIIGGLRTSTAGATATGETITFLVGGPLVDATGVARLDGSGRGLQAGQFVLGVDLKLDRKLEEPRTPMKPIP